MAPNLAKSQHDLISNMISSEANDSEIAEAAGCSTRSIRAIRSNIRIFGSSNTPRNSRGRNRIVILLILDALCEHLLEKPGIYRTEMVVFLWDEFEELVTISSIGRVLASVGWTKKKISRVARERNADLRDIYLYDILDIRSWKLVYVDK